MRKYENINPTDAEKMMYVCAGLYPIQRVKTNDVDFIKYGLTSVQNVYPSFITAYLPNASITFDNKEQHIRIDNILIHLQLMDILVQRCDELKWEFPKYNNELIIGVKGKDETTKSETMQNCMRLLIQADTFIEGIDFLAKHYDDLFF